MHTKLRHALRSLSGKECWSFIGGPGTGSMMTLDFGRKVAKAVRLPNPMLSPDQQCFDGEISLYVEFASWRFESSTAVICSSTSSNQERGPMQAGMEQVVGRRVKSTDLTCPGLDLTIEFEGSLWLRIFCDQTNTVERSDNYSLHLRDGTYVVGPSSCVEYHAKNIQP
jgi:hypothetical protein